jgi:hypothetical protein
MQNVLRRFSRGRTEPSDLIGQLTQAVMKLKAAHVIYQSSKSFLNIGEIVETKNMVLKPPP